MSTSDGGRPPDVRRHAQQTLPRGADDLRIERERACDGLLLQRLAQFFLGSGGNLGNVAIIEKKDLTSHVLHFYRHIPPGYRIRQFDRLI